MAIVTGAAGGIGQATCQALRTAGYRVVGLDRTTPPSGPWDTFVEADLQEVGRNERSCDDLLTRLKKAADGSKFSLLVNNAAVQVLGSLRDLSATDWLMTLHVNLSAPFMLARGLAEDLRSTHGVIVNIGSVHAQATKPGFSAYATSKAALHGLTRALAVDLAPEIRVVTIAPAAVGTSMLKAGFEGRPEAFEALESVHPVNRIGAPEEIGRAVVWVASPDAGFMTGATLWMDGGILSRLHDPL